MEIHKIEGYELEKEFPTTSEDYFNRSEVTFVEKGEERTLHVLYLRYFEERLSELVPFTKDPLYTILDSTFTFKQLVALFYLLKDPTLAERKRIYVNNLDDFKNQFQGIDFEKVPVILQSMIGQGKYYFKNEKEFVK